MTRTRDETKNKIKSIIGSYYGLIAVALFTILIIVLISCYGNKIYLCWNDNLDSNIALNKMYHDNNCLFDRNIEIPFLGGVSRDILTNGYSINGILYGILPTETAFAIIYVLHIIISGTGFYYLAILLERYYSIPTDANIFAICGLVFSMLGVWPSAYLDFAILPWWAGLSVRLFETKKWQYLVMLIILAYSTSFALVGAFIVMYLGIFYLIKVIVQKKWDWILFAELITLVIAYILMNNRHLLMAISGNKNEIKGLQQTVAYSRGILGSAIDTWKALLVKATTYHSGAFPLSLVAFPVVLISLCAVNIHSLRKRKLEKITLVFDLIFSMHVLNSIMFGYDKAWLRRYIPFFSGFSFSRAYWLSPFLIMILFALSMSVIARSRFKLLAPIAIVIVPLTIVCNSSSTKSNDMYNTWNTNYQIYARKNDEVDDLYWRWDEFYSEELFEGIKQSIGYKAEWAVGFGLDPAVLQYNKIHTLDGYYSNYDADYYYKWSKLMEPEFRMDAIHKAYWDNSGGVRAYIYSENWYMPNGRDTELVGMTPMRVDKGMLDELKCKYVFSRVEISNCKELNMVQLGEWENQSYHIYVYENKY